MRRLKLTVGDPDKGERLDRFIAARGSISRGLARRAIGAGAVFLEGRRCKVAGRALRSGQSVEVNLEESGRPAGGAGEPRGPGRASSGSGDAGIVPSARHGDAGPPGLGPERILHVDPDIAVIDKPSGVAAQATLTGDAGTLPDLVARQIGGQALVVHRLDRETSGVTVLARTKRACAALAAAFREGRVEKRYLALCAAAPTPPEGRIEAPLGKDPLRPGRRRVAKNGDPAATRYRTLQGGDGKAYLVEAFPETGRTHQIRVHLAHLGAPLLGDPRYGGARRLGSVVIPRVMLHARSLTIPHPRSGAQVTFAAPIPPDFELLGGSDPALP